MNYLLIASLCETAGVLKVLDLGSKVLRIAMLSLPIIVAIKGTVDIGKSLIMGDRGQVINEIITAAKSLAVVALVFFIPYFGKAFFSLMEDVSSTVTKKYNTCVENMGNIEYYEKLEETEREEKEAKRKQELEEEKEEIRNRVLETISSSSTSVINTPTIPGGNYMGQKYNLSGEQLHSIAYLAQKEQGSPEGAAAEASLMANRFELYGSKFGSGADGLYKYVRDGGWFANSAAYMNQVSNVKPEVLSRVKEVLVLGSRTLPLYVDEHDCINCGKHGYDINRIDFDGKKITSHSELTNRSNYVQGRTVIHNRYGAVYTFWSFPTPTSDPFGYTERAFNKVKSGGGTTASPIPTLNQ